MDDDGSKAAHHAFLQFVVEQAKALRSKMEQLRANAFFKFASDLSLCLSLSIYSRLDCATHNLTLRK